MITKYLTKRRRILQIFNLEVINQQFTIYNSDLSNLLQLLLLIQFFIQFWQNGNVRQIFFPIPCLTESVPYAINMGIRKIANIIFTAHYHSSLSDKLH